MMGRFRRAIASLGEFFFLFIVFLILTNNYKSTRFSMT